MRFLKLVLYSFFLTCALTSFQSQAQYQFSGELNEQYAGNSIYLSIIEDYRKIDRIYIDQILLKSTVDTTGGFKFQGDNLYADNRIYRIHLDNCGEESASDHFLGTCTDVNSVVFIANNQDTLYFPQTFDTEILCDIVSTNPYSGLILDIDALKEEMMLDFIQNQGQANQQLNLQKWFKVWHDYGMQSEEPLAELYIYEFLSDKRNPTYNHYLREVVSNPYYSDLDERLNSVYPNSPFTTYYSAEFTADQELARLKNPQASRVNYLFYIILIISLMLNLLLFRRWIKNKKKRKKALASLTPQEQKIVDHILLDMSNKEIADALFVSVSTIKTHINNLYKKLEVSDRDAIKALFGK